MWKYRFNSSGSDELMHFGIKGQKWGIRRYQNEDGSYTEAGKERYSVSGATGKKANSELSNLESIDVKTKNGKDIVLKERPKPKLGKFIARYLPSVRNNMENDKQFDITVDDKHVGDAEVFNEGNNSLNVVWVGVNNKERGNGYATAAMQGFVDYAKKNGYKQMTLEVPGDSPDAKHIYEKLGFKTTKKISDDDDVWGGLTQMVLTFDEDSIKHGCLGHFGIKGQKWGARRFQNEDGTLTEEGKERYSRQREQLEGAKYHIKKQIRSFEKDARDYDSAQKRLRNEPFDDAIVDVYGDKKTAYDIDETDDRIKESIEQVAREYEHKAKVNRDAAKQQRELLKKLSNVKLDGIKDEKSFTKEIANVLYKNEPILIKYINTSSLKNDIREYSDKQKQS